MYSVILPKSGKGIKEIERLLTRRRKQTEKAIEKLRRSPIDTSQKGIEKIGNTKMGQYTIRVSKGDRLFYDVDIKKKEVYILHAGPHDYYRLA